MKITLNNLDLEELENETFEKIKSKKHKLKGKQSVRQLISENGNAAEPDAKFENSDLNEDLYGFARAVVPAR